MESHEVKTKWRDDIIPLNALWGTESKKGKT